MRLSVCRARISPNATSPESTPEPATSPTGAASNASRNHSARRIPAHAHAKVSCRLVAAQDPDRIFEAFKAYVEEIAPPGVTTTVRLLGGGLPSLTPMDHPATQAAVEEYEMQRTR